MAEAISAEKKWSSMACISVDIFAVLEKVHEITKTTSEAQMSEDRQCLENTLSLVRLSKAFDMLANTSRAYSRAGRAFKIVETWVKTRDSDVYQVFLAPFYYKLADMLTAHIEINSDELGNIKPLDCESDESDQEEGI
jgi:hypothetical protein